MRSALLLLLRSTALLMCAPAWLAAQQPPPTVTAITPSAGDPGTAVTVVFTGTNFVAGASVDPNNSHIAVSNVVVVSTTQITATFTIAADAQGMSNVCVITSGGTAWGPIFAVTPATEPSFAYLLRQTAIGAIPIGTSASMAKGLLRR